MTGESMEIEPTDTTTTITFTFNVKGAEPIISNHNKIRMRPERATVIAVNGKIGHVTILGRALRPYDDYPLVGAPHPSVYGEQEVDEAPEVVRRVFEAASGQMREAAGTVACEDCATDEDDSLCANCAEALEGNPSDIYGDDLCAGCRVAEDGEGDED